MLYCQNGGRGVGERKQEWVKNLQVIFFPFLPCDQVTCRNFSVKQNYYGLFFRAAIRTLVNMCKLTGLMSYVARFY